jgi:predicted transcriptional regulator
MNEFIEMKERHLHPMRSQDVAEQVRNCTKQTIDALEKSAPICHTIQQEFQTCLESGQRVHFKCAKKFKESLEMCTAKYIGKLD